MISLGSHSHSISSVSGFFWQQGVAPWQKTRKKTPVSPTPERAAALRRMLLPQRVSVPPQWPAALTAFEPAKKVVRKMAVESLTQVSWSASVRGLSSSNSDLDNRSPRQIPREERPKTCNQWLIRTRRHRLLSPTGDCSSHCHGKCDGPSQLVKRSRPKPRKDLQAARCT
jgi:hypothetical protein